MAGWTPLVFIILVLHLHIRSLLGSASTILVTLLNSSWTTFILPTSLLWPVSIEGYSLDLSSSVFNTKLASDTAQFGCRDCASLFNYQNGYDILDIMASMSGTSATRLAVTGGNDSVFAFNGVSYSTSSGGILPAVEDYAGSTLPPGEYIGLEYYGGQVAVNISLVNDRGRSGLARSYTVTQQGLSANINCSYLADLDQSEFSMTVNNNNVSLPEGYIQHGVGQLIVLTMVVRLHAGYNFWVTVDFWLDNNEYDGFLGIVPCPAGNFTNPEVTSFDIFVRSYGEYGYLNPTVCHVAPYVALFNVTYNQSMISVDQHPHGPIQLLQNSSFVTAFISNVVYQLSISSQTAYNNPLGDLLRLKDSNSSLTDVLVSSFCHIENGKQIVLLSFLPLKCQYECNDAGLVHDKNAFTPLNGTMYITTYGWYRERLTYIYILCVFTVIWAVTVLAAVYKTLPGFEDNGDLENERARVRLLDGQDVAPDNAVGEKTSARPTRSTMPRFEIVPQRRAEGAVRLLEQGGSSFGFRQARGIVAAKGPSGWPHSVTAMRTKLLGLSRARATEEWRKSIVDEDVMSLAATCIIWQI
ncbi:hypothetical protein F4604DRAFT_1674928 [Suillus subluteus]|nr:hypothetical protein F4604DRAFT_1674928 [Suillus subluteus]